MPTTLEPTPPEPPPTGPPAGATVAPTPADGPLASSEVPAPAALPRKSGLAFFAVLVLLFGPGLFAQWLHAAGGLAWTQLFGFLLPAVVAAVGSNLAPVPYLGLGRPRPAAVGLGALAGGVAFLAGGTLMALWSKVLPARWVEGFDVARQLLEAPASERLAIAAVAVAVAPFCEEVAFRGYLQRSVVLRRGAPGGIAAAAFLFAVLHLDPVRFPALLLLGAVFGWLAWRSGSVWPAIAAHAANNAFAAALVLRGELPEPGADAEVPPAFVLVAWLVLFSMALALVLRAYRNATPVPPAPDAAVVRRDPAHPSTRFEPARIPAALLALAALGAALLPALALLR